MDCKKLPDSNGVGLTVRRSFPKRIIASPGENIHYEETRSDRIRGILCKLHLQGPGVRCIERSGIAAIADAAIVRGPKRAGRKLPVCTRKMDGEGSSRTHHGYRAHFCLPGIAVRARGSNAAPRLRAR